MLTAVEAETQKIKAREAERKESKAPESKSDSDRERDRDRERDEDTPPEDDVPLFDRLRSHSPGRGVRVVLLFVLCIASFCVVVHVVSLCLVQPQKSRERTPQKSGSCVCCLLL